MLDLIREIFEGTERNAFFGRIDDIGVADGFMRNDDLRMALGSQGSRFEERFFEPDALAIYVLSSFNIIDSVNNKVQVGPEVVIENMLVLGTSSGLQRVESNFRVHLAANFAGGFTFILTDVLSSEQKLSVQIADFDVVVISYSQFSVALG